MPKPLPIGIQSFEKLRTKGCLYVDKTRYIHRLITGGSAYFLSRPRRFGKSLLISTLEAIFLGKKELFRDLWIDSSGYDWKPYPVIRIDFSQFRVNSAEDLKIKLEQRVREIANFTGAVCEEGDYQNKFRELIIQLSANGKVVVLVDEYDKPIIDNIGNVENAGQIRDVLKGFYEVLKGLDEYLQFVFLTGVSKFSKVGVFSGLNHLEDISMSPDFSGLPGITQDELEENFQEYLTGLSSRQNCSEADLLDMIRHWYNGFCFAADGLRVYNPFSLLLMFKQKRFANFWFESATPTFLIQLLREQKFDVQDLENIHVNELAFSSYEIDRLDVLPILVQTGYLTIKGYDPIRRLYTLDYPNLEVRESFVRYLIDEFTPVGKETSDTHIWKLIDSMRAGEMDRFFTVLQIFFAGIPYDIQIKREKYYQTVFYLIFRLMGLQTGVEVRTGKGRIDAVVELAEGIFIFEFKIIGDADAALAQIHERGYAVPYLERNLPVYLIGAVFGTEGQGIVDWKAAKLPAQNEKSTTKDTKDTKR